MTLTRELTNNIKEWHEQKEALLKQITIHPCQDHILFFAWVQYLLLKVYIPPASVAVKLVCSTLGSSIGSAGHLSLHKHFTWHSTRGWAAIPTCTPNTNSRIFYKIMEEFRLIVFDELYGSSISKLCVWKWEQQRCRNVSMLFGCSAEHLQAWNQCCDESNK